jgi:hypothetical protein
MQLVAYGAQDVFLTGNPQITFFKIVYRRHTNFAIESIEQTFTGTSDFNRKVTATIARSGDLITKMYLMVQLPKYEVTVGEWAWVSRIGHALIDYVELEIGGTRIDRQYGDWLNVWYELARNWAQDRGYNKLIGNTDELTKLADSHNEATLYIPLQFFSNRHDGLAIPLIALQYHETKVNISFRDRMYCVNTSGKADMSKLSLANASLFVDYIYLDAEERKRFAQAQHEYLIEQVQFTGSESVTANNGKYRLNFNHPCKALYWNLQLGKYTSGKKFLAYDPVNVKDAITVATKRFVLACANYVSGALDLSNNLIQPNASLSKVLSDMFDEIQAVAITADGELDNITILGREMTLAEFSAPVDELFRGFSRVDNDNVGDAENDVTVYQWDNYGIFLDKSQNPVSEVMLSLNGHERFSKRDGAYFNYVQPYQCHSNTPCDGLNMYSFALKPEEHQPSGTCNFSRIDNATLSLDFNNSNKGAKDNTSYNSAFFTDSIINIYATNYNVLRIMSGMGGLAYSN